MIHPFLYSFMHAKRLSNRTTTATATQQYTQSVPYLLYSTHSLVMMHTRRQTRMPPFSLFKSSKKKKQNLDNENENEKKGRRDHCFVPFFCSIRFWGRRFACSLWLRSLRFASACFVCVLYFSHIVFCVLCLAWPCALAFLLHACLPATHLILCANSREKTEIPHVSCHFMGRGIDRDQGEVLWLGKKSSVGENKRKRKNEATRPAQ